MLRYETRDHDRRRTDDRRRRGGGLRTAVPLAVALVAGYLLWRRLGDRGSVEQSDTVPDGLADVASRTRQRLRAGGTAGTEVPVEATRPAGEESEAGPERAAIPAGVAFDDVERAVESLSAPTVRGMPMLGVGTHHHAGYDDCYATVRRALGMGYRHVDTTVKREAYHNESAVGDAVDEADVAREDVFLATKIDPADLDPEYVRISVKESLDRLGTEYVDLVYPRWPTEEYDARETLAALADLRAEGLVREIGVSNLTVDLLEEALDAADAPIFANQVEMHPLLPQEELREFCDRNDVELVAYSPLARGHVEDVDALQDVAAKHDASPEQVSLAWLREKGVTAVPRATSEAHLRENWLSLGVDLDAEDVATLDAIEERRRVVDPDDAPWNR